MARKDLDDFRKQWLSELQNKNIDKDKAFNPVQDKVQNDEEAKHCNNKTQYEKARIEHSVSSCENYEAFKIANNYMNISDKKRNKFCLSTESKHYEEDIESASLLASSSKRKLPVEETAEHSLSCKEKIIIDQHHSKNESLVDLLIADIDEITCIPFFDIELPKEIALKIFQFLSLKDLANCAKVSKQWQRIAEDDLLWFTVYKRISSNREKLLIIGQTNWKEFVMNYFLEKKAMQRKWKERLCEVHDLENKKGGILCACDICEEKIVVAYLDGSIKLWNLVDGTFGYNLKEQYTTDEDIITSICTCLRLSKKYCAAAFQNGDVMIWRIGEQLSGTLVYIVNYTPSVIENVRISECGKYVALVLDSNIKVLSPMKSESGEITEGSDDLWKWTVIYEKDFSEKIHNIFLSSDNIIVSTKCLLYKQNIGCQGDNYIMDQIAGAVFSCMDHTKSCVVIGINSFGYSVLGGFRIRSYCKTTGQQLTNIFGLNCKIDCLKIQNGGFNNIAVGCSDGIIRVYDMGCNKLMTSLPVYDSTVTSIQMDEWKVLSGHIDGTVVLWDRRPGIMCWQTKMKHPVYMCRFNNRLLVIVNIPLDKFPKNSNWYADDLVQHRKFRGSIRVLDFTKDTIRADTLPEEFHADYDNITGYDYNIQLIAPYDNVDGSMNLPRI